jgi:hypothetical protein
VPFLYYLRFGENQKIDSIEVTPDIYHTSFSSKPAKISSSSSLKTFVPTSYVGFPPPFCHPSKFVPSRHSRNSNSLQTSPNSPLPSVPPSSFFTDRKVVGIYVYFFILNKIFRSTCKFYYRIK